MIYSHPVTMVVIMQGGLATKPLEGWQDLWYNARPMKCKLNTKEADG